MAPEIKFCGLTRPEDAAEAARVGARYAGVIFAGGPRLLTPAAAARVLAPVPVGVRRVGVFGRQAPAEVARIAAEAGLNVVQLHAAESAAAVAAVRRAVDVEVWAVVRAADGRLPAAAAELAGAADALVVDSFVPGQLGGTGVATDWEVLADELARGARPARLVLAGGLRPETVARAVRLLSPDVLDVSSGVERAPGVKDHARMTAFADAARAGSPTSSQPA